MTETHHIPVTYEDNTTDTFHVHTPQKISRDEATAHVQDYLLQGKSKPGVMVQAPHDTLGLHQKVLELKKQIKAAIDKVVEQSQNKELRKILDDTVEVITDYLSVGPNHAQDKNELNPVIKQVTKSLNSALGISSDMKSLQESMAIPLALSKDQDFLERLLRQNVITHKDITALFKGDLSPLTKGTPPVWKKYATNTDITHAMQNTDILVSSLRAWQSGIGTLIQVAAQYVKLTSLARGITKDLSGHLQVLQQLVSFLSKSALNNLNNMQGKTVQDASESGFIDAGLLKVQPAKPHTPIDRNVLKALRNG